MRLKKPKFWDLKKPNFISYLLAPLTLPIIISNFIRNFIPKQKSKDLKTICVGNIYLGGTGKTPTTIKLFEILKKLNLNISTGKKFYKSHIDEITILNEKTDLITSLSRREIVRKAIISKKDLLIFDDGLQDNVIDYDIKFVCFDSHNWIGNGNLMPSGPLREKLSSLKKYDGIFIKNNNNINIENIVQDIQKINPKIEIFSTYYEPLNLNEFDLKQDYVIFSGIGNHDDFKRILLNNNFRIIKEIIFPDHFEYNIQTIDNIKKIAKEYGAKIITTKKDFVKIKKINSENINFLKIDLKVKNLENLIKFLELNI